MERDQPTGLCFHDFSMIETCTHLFVAETLFLNTYAKGSKLCTEAKNGYEATELRETPRPSQTDTTLSDIE